MFYYLTPFKAQLTLTQNKQVRKVNVLVLHNIQHGATYYDQHKSGLNVFNFYSFIFSDEKNRIY